MQRAPCPALSPLGTRVSQTFRVRAALYPVPPAGRKVKRLPWRLPCRFLMRVLDSYGDDYRSSQFTIVLEVSWGRGRAAGPEPGTRPPPAPSPVSRLSEE